MAAPGTARRNPFDHPYAGAGPGGARQCAIAGVRGIESRHQRPAGRDRAAEFGTPGAAHAGWARADRRQRQRSRCAGADPGTHFRAFFHDARARQWHWAVDRQVGGRGAWRQRAACGLELRRHVRHRTSRGQFMSKLSDAVLVVEDDAALREALLDTLRAAGLAALSAADAPAALQLLSSEDIGLVISDVHMPGANGYELLSSIKRMRPYLPVVLMTAYGTVSQAVAAMREGATDYIVKPFDAQALIAMAQRQLAARVTPNELIAVDPESKRLVGLARKIAENDATVLITGESGTGKEMYARLIPENMLEASLFGHEKGAFTGALAAHAGKFEQAQGGTLLLDEISEMDLGLQAKILRVLQEREVERLGSTRTITLDVRVIATSNRDLPEEVR